MTTDYPPTTAQVNQRISLGAEAAQAEAAAQRPLLEHAQETARTLQKELTLTLSLALTLALTPTLTSTLTKARTLSTIRPDAPFVGRALLASARAMDEGRHLVGQMVSS